MSFSPCADETLRRQIRSPPDVKSDKAAGGARGVEKKVQDRRQAVLGVRAEKSD
jgi:hypothetical protein